MTTNYGLSPTDTPDALPTQTNLSAGIGPEKFAEICRGIVTQHECHEAHRMLDQEVTRLLCNLGYGEGMAIFAAAVAPYHMMDAWERGQ